MPADTRDMPTSALAAAIPLLHSSALQNSCFSDPVFPCTHVHTRSALGPSADKERGCDTFTGINIRGTLARCGHYVERLLTINYGISLTVERIAIFSDVGNRPGYNSFDKF